MKRLVLSIIGGFTLTLLYSVIVGPFSTFIADPQIIHLLYVPIGWPKILLSRFVSLGSFPFRDQDNVVLLIFIVSCDVALYGLVTYVWLWRRSARKRVQIDLPPGPPQFEQIKE